LQTPVCGFQFALANEHGDFGYFGSLGTQQRTSVDDERAEEQHRGNTVGTPALSISCCAMRRHLIQIEV
jgi:hypothetical protein